MKSEVSIPKKWDDIVFENRNQDYGAYRMRKEYAWRVAASTFIAILIMGLAFEYPRIAKMIKTEEKVVAPKPLKQITVNLGQPPPITPNEAPIPRMDIPQPVRTVIKFLPPKVTDKEVADEEMMPTVTEIRQNETGHETVIGTGVEEVVVFTEPIKEVVNVNEEGDPEKIFLIVEQPPEFEGGLQELYKFLYANIRYPAQALRMGIEGNVYVSFVVDADGKISEVQIVKGIGAGCDEETLRVLKMMPPWKPGKQRGKPVKVRFSLPVKFKLATR
jgi:periplasmic protein TonB